MKGLLFIFFFIGCTKLAMVTPEQDAQISVTQTSSPTSLEPVVIKGAQL